MDNYNAILTIESTQWEEDETPETTRLTTEGRMARADGAWIFKYEESPESGMEDTSTTIRADDDGGIALIREGKTAVRMLFHEGKPHVTSMQTPYGVINVNLFTHRASSSITRLGGNVDLSYAIEFGSHHNMNTRLHIEVRRAGSDPAVDNG